MLFIVALLLLLTTARGTSPSPFTCQGNLVLNTATGVTPNAETLCPDKGEQVQSSGGNVTILVKYGTNIPNRKIVTPSSGKSDPYVKFTVGSTVAKTKSIRNSLNPVWDEQVNLGVLLSGTEMEVEV